MKRELEKYRVGRGRMRMLFGPQMPLFGVGDCLLALPLSVLPLNRSSKFILFPLPFRRAEFPIFFFFLGVWKMLFVP